MVHEPSVKAFVRICSKTMVDRTMYGSNRSRLIPVSWFGVNRSVHHGYSGSEWGRPSRSTGVLIPQGPLVTHLIVRDQVILPINKGVALVGSSSDMVTLLYWYNIRRKGRRCCLLTRKWIIWKNPRTAYSALLRNRNGLATQEACRITATGIPFAQACSRKRISSGKRFGDICSSRLAVFAFSMVPRALKFLSLSFLVIMRDLVVFNYLRSEF